MLRENGINLLGLNPPSAVYRAQMFLELVSCRTYASLSLSLSVSV